MAYTKHTWQSGEVITDEKLNNIETGVATLDTGKVNQPAGGNGTSGQVLSSNGDGTTEWVTPIQKQAAIADSVGGDEKDKINAILAALRTAGVIAAS